MQLSRPIKQSRTAPVLMRASQLLSVLTTLTGNPRRAAVAVGVIASLVLLGVAGRALWRAGDLQDQFNHGHALQVASAQIAPLLEAEDEAVLSQRVEGLVRSAELGLSFVSIRDPVGAILAVDGRYEALTTPFLSAAARQRLRDWLYRWTSDYGSVDLRHEGQVVGKMEYAYASSLAKDVRDQAVWELRVAGWAGLLLALPSALALGLVLFREIASPAGGGAPVSRLFPDIPEDDEALDATPVAPVATTLDGSLGDRFDALGRAILTVDRDARVSNINHSAALLTGWDVDEAQGRLVYSVFHPLDENHAPLVTPAESCLRERNEYAPKELLLRARDGQIRHIEVMAVLLADEADGAPAGAAMMFHDISERHSRFEELGRQARLSQGVIDHLVEGVLTTDPAGVIRFANARALRMFGYTQDELVGATATRLMPVPFMNSPNVRLADYAGNRGRARLPRIIGWRKDATTFPIELLVQPMTVDESAGLVLMVRDISDRMRSENLAQRLGRLLDAAAEEVYIFDAHSLYFVDVNQGARKNLGFPAADLLRMTPLTISADLEPDVFQNYLTRLRGGGDEHISYRCHHVRADGSQYPVEVRLNFSREEEPPVFMAIAVDITEQEQTEDHLRHLAQHDSLTGLPNRVVLIDRLRQACLHASRTNRQLGVFFVDLDRFKAINDEHGHEVGDIVLELVAKRLTDLLRESDTVARLGGDEFVVIAQGLRGTDDAKGVAHKIIESLSERMQVPGQEIFVTPSVGATLYPVDEADAEGLLRHADAAMYQAKQSGRGRMQIYDIELPPEKRRRLELERGIHAALALEQLHPEVTPVARFGNGDYAGLRVDYVWQHPRHGRVSSADVAPAALRAGMQAQIELWLLRIACMLKRPQTGRDEPAPMMVNLSGWQLRDADFAAHVFELMERFEVPPRWLMFVLTLDGLREAADAPGPVLQRLLDRGVRLALRGSPEQVFQPLNQDDGLRPELVILEGADIASVPEDASATERVRMALLTATGLGIACLADGVARDDALNWFSGQGCRAWSGPQYASAMRLDQWQAWTPGAYARV